MKFSVTYTKKDQERALIFEYQFFRFFKLHFQSIIYDLIIYTLILIGIGFYFHHNWDVIFVVTTCILLISILISPYYYLAKILILRKINRKKYANESIMHLEIIDDEIKLSGDFGVHTEKLSTIAKTSTKLGLFFIHYKGGGYHYVPLKGFINTNEKENFINELNNKIICQQIV